jgi:AraC-like DNA-binding protein
MSILSEPAHLVDPHAERIGETSGVRSYLARVEQSIADGRDRPWDKMYGKTGIGIMLSGWCEYRSQTGHVTGVPGTIFFGNQDEHFTGRYLGAPGIRRLAIWYDNDFLEKIADACGIDRPRFSVAALPPGKPAYGIFRDMLALIVGSGDVEYIASSLAETALLFGRESKSCPRISDRDRKRILSAVRHIDSDFFESCSVDALAAITGFSRYHFMRLFKTVTGQSANQYVIATRLRAAAVRIAETKAPVSDIAFDVGFNDISHFNTYFRAAFACSPRQLRNRYRS